MRLFSLVALIAVSLTAVPSRADAITLREVIELTKAGLGEEVLLALIEIDQRVYPIDPATIRSLKDAGVSEKVIVAMVKSGRTPQPQPEPQPNVVPAIDPPEPQVVVIEHDRPVVHQVAVPVPVYVAVPTHRGRGPVYDNRAAVDGRNLYDNRNPILDNRTPLDNRVQPVRKPAEPVYWGWGGKLRPDAWKPSPAETPRDPQRHR